MSLFRNAAVQSGMTLLSRLLGFARDLVLAAKIGAGPVGDAFYTALQLPNLFRRIFAEGAFAQAFVPAYARTLQTEGKEQSRRTASDALSMLLTLTLGLTILMQICMPFVMLALFYGYRNDPQTFNLAILLTQITMPYLACMAAAALFQGVLNTAGRFALAAGAPTLLNLCILGAALLANTAQEASLYASIAVFVSGVLQASLLYWGCARLGVRLSIGLPKLTPEVKRIMLLAVPGTIAGSATQINIAISQALASMEVGAKSWLNFADRLYQLPLGLVGVAVGLAILPRLAKATRSGDPNATSKTMDEALVLSMAFTLPAAVALMAAPFFLADGLFARGEFTSFDAQMTALALFHFGWGVPAFVLIKVLAPPFFAREDTRTPMLFAIVSMVLNTVLGAGLFFWLGSQGAPGFQGLAVATSVAAWANVILLGGALVRQKVYRPGLVALSRLIRVGIASAIMAAALLWANSERARIEALFGNSKFLAIIVVILLAALLYMVAAFAVRAVRISEIKTALRRVPADERDGTTGPSGADL
jgi:putative peptidoglycan lipid II flippase